MAAGAGGLGLCPAPPSVDVLSDLPGVASFREKEGVPTLLTRCLTLIGVLGDGVAGGGGGMLPLVGPNS